MKARTRIWAARALACAMLLACLLSHAPSGAEIVDWAGSATLNMASETVKTEVTVKTFVDGDTTHFIVPKNVSSTGVLKARYLAVNTPEISGRIEEYGKRAATFTRDKLENAASILIESDDGRWNLDSTGERHLVWVWYRPSEASAYRNLNIELLQNGLAIANSSANNRYGSLCMAAIAQAREQKLSVYSGARDPDFYYGDAIELTLRELRLGQEQYVGKKVAFSGVVTVNDGGSVYIEQYDPDSGLYFGVPVYYGYGLSGAGLAILSVGNESRVVGTLQYYEAGGTYQVSGVTYRMMKPKDPGNLQKLSDGHAPAYASVSPERFSGAVAITDGEGTRQYPWAALCMSTSVAMQGLKVKSVSVTSDQDSASYGAMTLRCDADGTQITVRVMPLRDEKGALLTKDAFLGKTIDVKGFVDYFDGAYQIKAFTRDAITVYPQ